MILPTLTSTHEIHLTCLRCHTAMPVTFTVRQRPSEIPGQLIVSCTLDPRDAVMARVWADAHHGPFEKRRP